MQRFLIFGKGKKVYILGNEKNIPHENSTIFLLGSPAQVNSWSLKSDI